MLVLKENDTVELEDYKAKIIETPGHTAGHIIYWFDKEKVLFLQGILFLY